VSTARGPRRATLHAHGADRSAVLTVVNVGGGLARPADDRALAAVCRVLGEAAGAQPIVVVPGGGEFTDAVRDAGRRFALRSATAHRMALLAMDQFGCLLGDLIPDAVLCPSVTRARDEAESGRAAILLPAEQLAYDGTLPDSWALSSESIAVWVAGVLGGARALLITAADARLADDWSPGAAPAARVSASELAALHAGGAGASADADMPRALHAAGVDARVVSGRDPDRLLQLLRAGEMTGTQLTPAAEERELRRRAPP
jgi:aspartokinase-like uncharacterized kinase